MFRIQNKSIVGTRQLFVGLLFLFLLFPFCKPLEQELKVKVETGTVTSVGFTLAVIEGKVVDAGDGNIEQHGFCYGTTENPTILDENTRLGARSTTGGFSDSLVNLQSGTKYYVRAYAIASDENYYGDQTTFTTLSPTSPVVAIESVGSYENDSSEIKSTVTDDGGSAVTARGVCWSLAGNPTTLDGHTVDGTGTGSFTSFITGLDPDTSYYIRAYATSAVATSYSSQHQVSTPAIMVEVTTAAISGITMTGAVSGGTVTAGEGAEITARGVCWSLTENPDLNDNFTTDGIGAGSFNSSITGLSAGTTYYVRAYATGPSGTVYGNQLSFTTTSPSASLPVLSTSAVTGITENSAVSGGNITDDGGSAVSARGVCWSTSHNPDLSDAFTTDGAGTGIFTSAITGLSSNTTYYVRAFATNGDGTSYGAEVNFTTSQSLYLPTLTTATPTSITETTAVSGGNITDNGGTSIIARGVCWSVSTVPDLTGSHTTSGTGTGSFTSSVTGLNPNTTYYVRAYATNGLGTAYGDEVSFATNSSPALPTLTTTAVNNIATISAKSGGEITNNGGTMVIARGVCWSTSPYPDLESDHSSDGAGTGIFISAITGLNPNTLYYVRAYATNGTGTGYGNEVSFTTTDMGETVTDLDGNVYQTLVIGTQTWMAENLRSGHFSNGDPIPQVSDLLDWTVTKSSAYCYYDNDFVTYGETYGALYNWYAVDDSRNICPSGWHVPTNDEWETLSVFAGGNEVAGAKLKEAGTDHWAYGYGTNEFGFTALPAGYRGGNDGVFTGVRYYSKWWTSTKSTDFDLGIHRDIEVNKYSLWYNTYIYGMGLSVRCLKN